jgi:hypothetical protein
MARECWAHTLGGCDSISREHVVSKGVFSNDPDRDIAYIGMKRIPDGFTSADPLTAKILCRHHNSALSPLDSHAKLLSDALHAMNQGPPKVSAIHLKGLLLERWLFKSVVNQMASGLGDDVKWSPSCELVEMIYGERSVPPGMGLYSLTLADYLPRSDSQVVITPLWYGVPDGGPRRLRAAIVYLHGAAFFAAFSPTIVEDIRKNPVQINRSSFPVTAEKLKYHPPLKSVECDDGRSLLLMMDWA